MTNNFVKIITDGFFIFLFCSTQLLFAQPTGSNRNVNQYNVVWDSPCKNALGSMPVGNADIGLNVRTEENGDLLFYIGKTDTFDENGHILKPECMRSSLTTPPLIWASNPGRNFFCGTPLSTSWWERVTALCALSCSSKQTGPLAMSRYKLLIAHVPADSMLCDFDPPEGLQKSVLQPGI